MPSDPATRPPVHNPDVLECDDEESSAGALEPGLLAAPQPLGLDASEIAQTQRDSADSRFSQWRRRGSLATKVAPRRTVAGVPLPVRTEPASGDEGDQDTGEPDDQPDRKSRAAQALSYIRGKLSKDGLAEITAMIHDPSLALTTVQADILNRIGRYGSHGDKSGVRRGLMELVEKLDVSSPADSAVVVAREGAGEVLSSNVTRQIARLEGGKQSLEMTQGGRVIGKLQNILGEHKAFAWTDGLDRGWRRLTERFGQQATGAVDVVVGAQSADAAAAGPAATAPAQTPVGSWNASSGADAPTAQPVGSWVMPESAGAAGPGAQGQPATGKWTTGAPSTPGGSPTADAPQVGKWSVAGSQPPVPPGQPGSAPVGQWTPPADPGAGSADKGAAPVGKWTTSGANPASPEIGKWNVPGTPAGGQVPGATGDVAKPAVGQWNVPQAGTVAPDQGVGRWESGAVHPMVGKIMSGGDVAIADDLNLSELLKQNPNISNVRLVELVQAADAKQPPKLRMITDLARSVFGKKFGF